MKHDQQFRLVGTATVGPKGQVVIPAEVRESMGIKPGDKLIAIHVCPKNAIAFITEEQAQAMVNKLGDRVIGFQQALDEQKK
jgi:AbrB family looped-hinge helix DNA binding protein